MVFSPLLLILSFLADCILGDPEQFPHPVRWIGGLISLFEKGLRHPERKRLERIKGVLLVLSVLSITGLSVYLILRACIEIHFLLASAAWLYLGYSALAIRDLIEKARDIQTHLEIGNLETARQRLSMIVGRDTDSLSEEDVARAAVESVAESTNDGIVAPLFYLVLGGPVAAFIYKAINTMDSMIGHRNETYRHFGWFAARLDDAANFIPARITGLTIVMSSGVLFSSAGKSLRIMLRDRKKHASPNSGISESAMAGALGIRLGGPCTYNGFLSNRPNMGDPERDVTSEHIRDATELSLFSSLIILVFGAAFQCWIIL